MPKKILLADDSITIQKVISITFAAEDYEITIAGDGDSAIERAKAIRPDLVMADVAMPGKNGYQVCDLIKKDPALKNTPVILLSGTFEPLNKEEAARVKADANIVKPFESQELTERVKELLAKSAAAPREAVISQPIAPPPAPAAAPPAPEKKPEPLIWEARDFVSFTEETEEKSNLPEPSLDFLEGLEGPLKEDLSEPEEFMDLGPIEEEKPKTVEPPVKKEEAPPAFDLGHFEAEEFKPEPFKTEPIEFVPPGEPSRPASEAPKTAFAEEPIKPEELPWFAPEKPAGTGIPAAAKAIVEEPQEETDLLEVPPELIEEKVPVEPRVPEMKKEAAPQVTRGLVDEVAGRAGEKIKEDLSGRLPAGLALPKEQLEEIVQKVAREVIEEIAWEVVPELAEDLIKAEINKFKESISRLK
jgi:CheY-like chemotaxis protein